ncbi:MAG: ABC transporter ATP-binding protein, partial [Gammaproteobacteria bacterium]
MIEARELTKRYGSLTAVDALSFSVAPGEVLGFLGPNGAGKTTTMRMLVGFVPPTSGTVSINGLSIDEQPTEVKSIIGYLPEGAPSYGEMTPLAFLDFIADIRKLTGQRKTSRIGEVVERLHLQPVLGQTIDTLSKGFKRRVGLAQAILHDPPVLIMDEPTDGLDPNQKHEVRQLIQDMASDKIIVISTHILEEVDAVCSRAVIISRGRIVADDTPDALIRRSRFHNAVTIRLHADGDLNTVEVMLKRLTGVRDVEVDQHARSITAFPRDDQAILS